MGKWDGRSQTTAYGCQLLEDRFQEATPMTPLRLARTLCRSFILVVAFGLPAIADTTIIGTIHFTVTGCFSYIGGPVINCPGPSTLPAASFTYDQTTAKFITFIVTYAGATYDFVNDLDLYGNPVLSGSANNPQMFGSVPCVSGATGWAATLALLPSGLG